MVASCLIPQRCERHCLIGKHFYEVLMARLKDQLRGIKLVLIQVQHNTNKLSQEHVFIAIGCRPPSFRVCYNTKQIENTVGACEKDWVLNKFLNKLAAFHHRRPSHGGSGGGSSGKIHFSIKFWIKLGRFSRGIEGLLKDAHSPLEYH